MEKMTGLVRGFLKREQVPHLRLGKLPVFKVRYKGDTGSFLAYVIADEADRSVQVCTFCPVNVATDKHSAALELVTRINCGLKLGSFDFDMDKGLIHFRTSLKLGSTIPDHETLTYLFKLNLLATDTFFPAISSTMRSDISCEKAIAEALSRSVKRFQRKDLELN